MPNVHFQGAELFMSSGASATVTAKVDRVQDIQVDYSIPRVQTSVIGRFTPLNDQPVVNYTPVSLSISYTKGNKDVERNLGLLNTTGIGIQIGQGTDVADWGARNFSIMNVPMYGSNQTLQYAGQWDVVSGVLKGFSLQGGVGEVVKGSFNVEAIDLRQIPNTSARTIPSYSGNLIKPQGVTLTGINFTGFGLTGLTVQSFSFQASFDHAQTFQLGKQYPERRVTNIGASLQVVGFLEGASNALTSLTGYDPGSPYNGQYVLTLQPSCGNEPATTITLNQPYLTSQSMGIQVGNFTQATLAFALPVSIVPFEATGAGMGSNVTIT
jgi:hypothetical protein